MPEIAGGLGTLTELAMALAVLVRSTSQHDSRSSFPKTQDVIPKIVAEVIIARELFLAVLEHL